jgi:CubicO group peptidase (beta-lactamase class C family)
MRNQLILLFLFLPFAANSQLQTISGRSISVPEFERQLTKKMDSLKVKGMSVALIRNGKVVYDKGFGYADSKAKKPVGKQTLFEAASLSKAVFATYVQHLAAKGLIDMDRPLYEYLPNEDIDDLRYKKINARMVLSHTTGLPNWRETKIMKLAFEPGSQFGYSGEAFMYLAKVIAHLQKTTLKELDEHFQKTFAAQWKLRNFNFVITKNVEKQLALGYQGDSVVHDDRDRTFFDPAGGLYANAGSFSQFLVQVLENKKRYEGLFEQRVELKPDDPIRQYFGIKGWTLGLAVIPSTAGTGYWHGGNNLGFTSSFMIDPIKEFGYVFLTNADQCNDMKKVFEDMLWK